MKNKHKREQLTPEQRAEREQLRRMKERAAILSIAPLGGGLYQVWGGNTAHLVTSHENALVTCDCRGWAGAKNHNCSHVMKYRITYGDLKK